jgi:hypothetical protein
VAGKGKKGGKAKVACQRCMSKMASKDVACRKCGQPRAGTFVSQPGAAKAVFQPIGSAAFVAKSARPRCGKCRNASRAGARHCTSCGSALLGLVKSAGDPGRDALVAKWRREENPEFREAYWRLLNPIPGAGGGQAS